jgi:DMSO/TMAO reductase YedYZ heme-binding membrane subunit
MPTDKEIRAFLGKHRHSFAAALAVLAAGMLAVPPLVIGLSTGGWNSWLSWVPRLTSLYAFTLIFMNIVTGALAPYFYPVFKARGEYLIHTITGSLGFLLALSHGLIILTQRTYKGYSGVWLVGPIALILLAGTVWVALDRVRLKKVWRVIHQINYAIFIAIYVKAVLIGSDFRLNTPASIALMVIFTAYMAIAAVALLLRFRRYRVLATERKKRAAAKELAVEAEGAAPAE